MQKIYYPDTEDVKTHQSQEWFNNAKLGIFIHWGLYSVPAFAPTPGAINEIIHNDSKHWFMNNAYAEWYLNTLRIKGSPTYQYHLKTYGEDFDYYSFSKEFNQELKKWSPEKMAEIFTGSGARYVVLTTKHHDGFTLWPSRVKNNNMPENCEPVSRDIVGELARAVRNEGMKMGLYYSGGLDWTFVKTPIMELSLMPSLYPQSPEYAALADAHVRELIEKYKPDVLWNDITYPKHGDLTTILSDYYNLVPGGVINNRWGIDGLHDFTTPEYTEYEAIVEEKWESCRGLGYSFGYNQYEGDKHTISATALIHLLIDIVSKNGNLLLNVGPTADGAIPEIQLERLNALGEWLAVNGEAIYDTRPWKIHGGKTSSGKEYRITRKNNNLYLIFLERPEKAELIESLVFRDGSQLRWLADGARLQWDQKESGVEIKFSAEVIGDHAFVLELSELPDLK